MELYSGYVTRTLLAHFVAFEFHNNLHFSHIPLLDIKKVRLLLLLNISTCPGVHKLSILCSTIYNKRVSRKLQVILESSCNESRHKNDMRLCLSIEAKMKMKENAYEPTRILLYLSLSGYFARVLICLQHRATQWAKEL